MNPPSIGPREAPQRYKLVRRLGAGSMGVVYEAFDCLRARTVALKTLHRPDPARLADLKREFRMLQGVLHPNLVRVEDLFESTGTWCITMELVQGVDYLSWLRVAMPHAPPPSQAGPRGVSMTAPTAPELSDVVRSTGPRADPERLRGSLQQLAAALAALHEAGLVHRDIKPSNILVTPSGRLVVLDFGLVRPVVNDEALAWSRAGTPAYMAPEQADEQVGSVTGAADCYALGVVLYQALTGRLPFVGPAAEVLAQKRVGRPIQPRHLAPEVPPDLERLCLELLAPMPSARPTAAAIAAELTGKAAVSPRRRASPIFVGRAEELDRIRDVAKRAALGRASVVLVTGESGIGKTALVEEAISRFKRDHEQAMVLRGRCFEREVAAYAGVDMLVDSLVGHLATKDDDGIRLSSSQQEALLQVFPTLSMLPAFAQTNATVPVASPESRLRAQDAFRELLGKVALRHELLMAVDDAQWLTEDSLAMLRALLGDREQVPFVLLLAGRDVDGGRLASWLAELSCTVCRIDLAPLTFADSVALLRAHLGDADPHALAEMATDGAGHPFFLRELANSDVTAREHRRLDDLLMERAARLQPAHRELVDILCAVPRPVDGRVLAEAAGTTWAELIPSLQALAHRRWVLVSPERFEGTAQAGHDRIRAALRPHISSERMRGLQARVASAMEAHTPGDVEGLALQWSLAGDRPRSARYARAAAARAVESLAFERAATLYQLAIDEAQTADDRNELLAAQARALVGAGRGVEAAERYLAAAEATRAEARDDLIVQAAEQLVRSGRVEEGKRVLARVLEDLDMRLPTSALDAVTTILRKRVALQLRFDKRPRRADEQQSRALKRRVDACWSVGDLISVVDPMRAAALHSEGLLRALDLGDPFRLARLLCTDAAFVALPGISARAAAERRLQRARSLAQDQRAPELNGYLALGTGVVRLQCGEFEAAQRELDQAEVVFQGCPGAHWELTCSREFALWTLAYRGRLQDLDTRLVPALAAARARGDTLSTFKLLCGPTHLLMLAKGQVDQLIGLADAGVAGLVQTDYPFLHFCGLFARSHARIYRGDAADVLEDIDAQRPHVRRAQLHRGQFFRIDLEGLRGRAALAALAKTSSTRERQRLYGVVSNCVRRLRNERVPWASARAEMLDACLATARLPAPEAAARLRAAACALDTVDLGSLSSAAAWQAARLDGGDAGPWSTASLIDSPDRLAQTLAPLPLTMPAAEVSKHRDQPRPHVQFVESTMHASERGQWTPQ